MVLLRFSMKHFQIAQLRYQQTQDILVPDLLMKTFPATFQASLNVVNTNTERNAFEFLYIIDVNS